MHLCISLFRNASVGSNFASLLCNTNNRVGTKRQNYAGTNSRPTTGAYVTVVIQLIHAMCRSVTLDDRVAEVLRWFDGDAKDFPDLGVLYFEEPDKTGHEVGPLHSKVSNVALIQT